MIVLDEISGGYAVFRDRVGGHKLAIITTSDHHGLFRNGRVVLEAMPRSSWTIHFTSAQLHLEEVEEIMAALPEEANEG